jgi:hypothetical protein
MKEPTRGGPIEEKSITQEPRAKIVKAVTLVML